MNKLTEAEQALNPNDDGTEVTHLLLPCPAVLVCSGGLAVHADCRFALLTAMKHATAHVAGADL